MRIQIVVFAALSFLVLVSVSFGQDASETVKANRSRRTSIHHSIANRSLVIIFGNRPLHNELEIQDYQMEDLKQLRFDFQKKVNAAARAKTSGRDRQEKLAELFLELESDLTSVLLPHQSDRLKEIAYQSFAVSPQTGRLNVVNLVAHPAIRSEIGITPEQVAELKQQAKAEKQRLEKEIDRLRKESDARLLEGLASEQKEKLEQMVGEWFDFGGYAPSRGGQFRKLGDDH